MNKWALGIFGFRFPFLLTTCESAAAVGRLLRCWDAVQAHLALHAASRTARRCSVWVLADLLHCHLKKKLAGHMGFSFLVLAPVAMREPWESHKRTLEKQWKGEYWCAGMGLADAGTAPPCAALSLVLAPASLRPATKLLLAPKYRRSPPAPNAVCC